MVGHCFFKKLENENKMIISFNFIFEKENFIFFQPLNILFSDKAKTETKREKNDQ